MKTLVKKLTLFSALLFGLTAAARADSALFQDAHRFGIGLIGGSPTGITAKYWFDDVNALDVAVGSFGYYHGLAYYGVNVHVDYLWHRYGVFGHPGDYPYRRLPIYLGFGGVINTPGVAGARAVFGLTWLFDEPFDVFFELAPTLVLAPFAGFGINAGLGGRFYF